MKQVRLPGQIVRKVESQGEKSSAGFRDIIHLHATGRISEQEALLRYDRIQSRFSRFFPLRLLLSPE